MRVASLGGTEAGLGRGAGADMMTASALAQLCSLGLQPCPGYPTPASQPTAGRVADTRGRSAPHGH